jgi:DNA mismatch repair protein MutL
MNGTPSIRRLPNHLIDQIKAGEVVDGPASILKELIENSIDANATRIEIQLENGGMDLISIQDNGDGITFGEMPTAFQRHTTSKLRKFEDVYNLHSFGFRGEALAAISSVSRVSCSSIPVKGVGGKIVLHGGEVIGHHEFKSAKQGLCLYIRDLFYNTPVRLDFLRSKRSQKNALFRVLYAFILSNPKVHFSIRYDDEEKQVFGPYNKLADCFFRFMPKNNAPFLNIQGEYQNHKISGLIFTKSARASFKKFQFFFVNNRLFNDRALYASLVKSMEDVWPVGESGAFCLFLTIPHNLVDINIHPRKSEVRFLHPSIMFSLLQASVKKQVEKSSTPVKLSLKGDIEETFTSPKKEKFAQVLGEQIMRMIRPTKDFFIFEHGGLYHLVNIPSLLKHYLLLNLCPVEEKEITPLLISEAYPMPRFFHQKRSNELKSLGFLLESEGDKTLLLKSVPEKLMDISVRAFFGDILKLLGAYPEKTVKEAIKDHGFVENDVDFSLSQLQVMIRPFISDTLKYPFIKTLTQEVLYRVTM